MSFQKSPTNHKLENEGRNTGDQAESTGLRSHPGSTRSDDTGRRRSGSHGRVRGRSGGESGRGRSWDAAADGSGSGQVGRRWRCANNHGRRGHCARGTRQRCWGTGGTGGTGSTWGRSAGGDGDRRRNHDGGVNARVRNAA
ncbi:hypothetical protein FJTKL_03143 [Diaporthe vaccinii]|uniref:Uncharacterized protein n=1 Tax=Diaporthe vaccinii TaxID=105482 RepID=A0ABR4DW10_9PEZI